MRSQLRKLIRTQWSESMRATPPPSFAPSPFLSPSFSERMPRLSLLVTLAAVICVHGLPVSPDDERLRSGGEVHGARKGEGEQVAPAVVSGRPVHAAGRTVLSSEDNCLSWTERLPASLWGEGGGSGEFGGPQSEVDGSIDMWGSDFGVNLLSEGKVVGGRREVVKKMTVKIKERSIVKLSTTITRGRENDAQDPMIAASVKPLQEGVHVRAMPGVEKGGIIIPDMPEGDAEISITVSGVDGGGGCIRFNMHIVVAPRDAVQNDLGCEGDVPSPSMPPSSVRVSDEEPEYHMSSDQFTITRGELTKGHSSKAGGLMVPSVGSGGHHGLTFGKSIQVEVLSESATLFATAGFDWATCDLHLILGASGHELLVSNESLAIDKDSAFETETSIGPVQLQKGVHILTLSDFLFPSLISAEEAADSVCLPFSFSIDLVASGAKSAGDKPRLLSVEPSGADSLEPGKDLAIELRFSDKLTGVRGGGDVPDSLDCETQSEENSFLCSNALFLFNDSGGRGGSGGPDDAKITPRLITKLPSGTLVVKFPTGAMREGDPYVLHVQEDYFKSKGRNVDVEAHVRAHRYTVRSCTCSGRGTCDVEGLCTCDVGYHGRKCDSCSEGYKGVGIGKGVGGGPAECIAMFGYKGGLAGEKAHGGCDKFTCSGHGSCLQPSYAATSSLVCLCTKGYANTEAGDKCGGCEEGYHGYPDCRRESEAGERDEAQAQCLLPTLPAVIGVGDDVGGHFFLDRTRQRHEISVRFPRGAGGAVVRVQAQGPSDNVWVRTALEVQEKKAGKWEVVDLGDGMGGLTAEIQEDEKAMSHRIVVAYEFLGEGGKCDALGLQAGVFSEPALKKVAKSAAVGCPSAGAGERGGFPSRMDAKEAGGGMWSVEGGVPREQVGWARAITVSIPAVPGKIARLTASVGYKFELASVGLALEAGDGAECGMTEAEQGGERAGEDQWPEEEFSDGAWGEDFDGGHDDGDDDDDDDEDENERGSGSGSGRGGYHGDPFDFFDSVGHGDDDYDDDGDDGDDDLDRMLGDDDYEDEDEDEDGGWSDEDDDEDDFNPWKMLSKVRGPFGSIHHLLPAFQHPALGYGLPAAAGGRGGGGEDGGVGGHFVMPTHFGGRRRLLSDEQGDGPLAGRRRRRGGQAHRDGECLNSTLHVNGASLDTTLPPGEYKLWVSSMLGPAGLLLEEQEPPGGGCIPVSLAVSVSYEDPQPSPSTCAGRTVPASFDEAGYMSNGRMHVQAQYSVYSVSAEWRHAISLTVSKESVIRAHVQGRSHVDMRLALFRDEGAGKAFMIDSEAPLVSDGVRGDALLAKIDAGTYSLQLTFENPGGGAGIPGNLEDEGESGCEEIEFEVAVSPLSDYSQSESGQGTSGWCAPSADRVPTKEDLGVIREGTRFGLRDDDDDGDGDDVSPGDAPEFFVHTKDGGRGLILGEYPIVVEGEAVLRAGVRSDFLLDDVRADVYNKDGSIALVGKHSLSHNRVEGVLRRGEYILKIRGPLSASKLLLASAAGDWEELRDEQGQAYYHSKSLGKTSWDPPAADAGTWCVRYALYASLEPASASGGCPHRAQSLPMTLNLPGLLGHQGGAMGATLGGLFRADGDVFHTGLGSPGGVFKESTGPVRYVSMRLERRSTLRLALWGVSGGLASATLLKSRHNGSAETVAGSRPWAQGDYSSSGDGWPVGDGDERRQLLDVIIDAGDYKLGLSFPSSAGSDSTEKSCPLLSLSLSLSPVSTSPSSCSGGDTWPEIPENINQKLSGCGPDTPSTDRCMQDVYSAKFTYSASPSWRRYHFFTAAGDSTHFRAEVGFNTMSPPLALLLSPLPCPPGIGPCDLGDETEAVDPSNQIWSVSPAEGYSVLSVPYLTKGSYLLTLMEMAGKTVALSSTGNVGKETVDDGKVGCVPFSLRIRTSRASDTTRLSSLSATAGGNPPVPLPTTLNTVMYLKYGGTMHSFGTYAFPRSGACKHTVTFDLGQDSRFRLDARAVAGGRVTATVTKMGEKVPQMISLLDDGSYSGGLPPSLQRAHLFSAALPRGDGYAIELSFLPDDWSLDPPTRGKERGLITMQLSIEPSNQDGGADGCGRGDANDDSGGVPPVGISDVRNGRFEYAPSHALSLKRETKRHTLHVTPITLASPSRVHAVVSSNFDRSPLLWVLTKGGGSGHWRGRVAKGGVCVPTMSGCELDAVVEAGDYSLRLWQPIAGQGPEPSSPGCVSYRASLAVSSQDEEEKEAGGMKVEGSGGISGCSDKTLELPSKLKMRRGIWSSPRVSMPNDGLGSGTSRTSFTLNQAGPTRVFITATSYATTSQVSLRLEASGSAQLEGGEPTRGWSESDGYSWDVVCSKPPCTLTLVAHYSHEQTTKGCPTLSLGVFVRSRKEMGEMMACPPGAGTSLPPSELPLDRAGRAVAQFDAVLPVVSWPQRLESCSKGKCTSYHNFDTSIKIKSTSIIFASISHDPLSSPYSLLLMSLDREAGKTSVVTAARQVLPDADVNAASPLLELRLFEKVPPGEYAIRVERKPPTGPSGDASLLTEQGRAMCSPISWRASVTPANDGETQVLALSPAGIGPFSPSIMSENFEIEVALSSEISRDTTERSFILTSTSPTMRVGRSATWKQDGKDTQGHPSVILAFKTSSLQRGISYHLGFSTAPGLAPRGKHSRGRIAQPPNWNYTLPAFACSGHGKADASGLCQCRGEWRGWLCDACEAGECKDAGGVLQGVPAIEPGAAGKGGVGGEGAGEKHASVWDEEKEGDVVDLDDGDDDSVDEGRVKLAHEKSHESKEWESDNVAKSQWAKEGGKGGGGRGREEGEDDLDGAVDADEQHDRDTLTNGRLKTGVEKKRLAEKEREHAIERIEKKGEEVVQGSSKEDGESWSSAVGRNWAIAAGAGSGTICFIAVVVLVLSAVRKNRRRTDERSFEERYKMTAFDGDDL